MPDLTVAQNIFIGQEPRRGPLLSERSLNQQTDDLLERLAVHLDPRALVGDLTVAKQQMVEIAKALSYDPQVLIMDEPTAALNDAEVAILHELIRRFVSDRTGVIYISHRMDELQAVTDRITVIRDGRYVDTLDTAGDDDARGHLADGGASARRRREAGRRARRPCDGAGGPRSLAPRRSCVT